MAKSDSEKVIASDFEIQIDKLNRYLLNRTENGSPFVTHELVNFLPNEEKTAQHEFTHGARKVKRTFYIKSTCIQNLVLGSFSGELTIFFI